MLYDVEVRENNTQEFDNWVGDYTEAETKEEAKQDIIIEKLDKVQMQNGIIMSAIGDIIFVMLDRKDKLDLNVIHKASLSVCLTTISLSLKEIQEDVGMCTEGEVNQSDKEANDVLDMILELLK